jgi:chitin synthase
LREEESSGWKWVRQKLLVFVKDKRFRIFTTWIALFLQIGSVFGILVVLLTAASDYWRLLIAIPIALVVLSIVWCSPVQEYLNTPQRIPADDRPMASARWKNGVLTGLWRVLSLPAVAIAMVSIQNLGLNVDIAYIGRGLWQLNDISEDGFFLANIFSSWGGYVAAWLACTLMMDIAGFFIPLLLATPVTVIVIVAICRYDGAGVLACGYNSNGSFDDHGIVPVCLALLWVSQVICFGLLYLHKTRLIPLIKEEKLFIQSYYNALFTEQCLFLNRRTEFNEHRQTSPRQVAPNSNVFVCTTMYREQVHEQRQLLESLHGIACEQAKHKTRNFESHIFFDGGAKGRHTTEFANQLFSLLHETVKIDLKQGEKWETSYGLQLKWKLAGDMPFYVHLKDPNKVKKKKRWSQVMYMSYVLDYRCPRTNYDDDDTFILTTDADIVFSREAVEILIDLLGRDEQVGAVCGRVHPLGSGPVVWYQIFDYAIGHWFQKVAEHVLGSVMCCPGCFSVFRARALRDILPTYATKVEKAKDFLTKDMGEDRWLCTLMVQAGWRLEYSAAADSYTYCPDNFDEFYKQRRRWMPSTMANLTELCTSARQVIANNDAVSILFIAYQAAMVFSTIIAPGTVILLMAAGTTYAFYTSQDYDSNGTNIAFLVIYSLTAVGYGAVCLWCNQNMQLQTAKVLTFIFAIIMAAVFVGVAVQIAQGLGKGDDQSTPTTNPSNTTQSSQIDSVSTLEDIAVSTWYLAGLAAVYIVAALLHPTEFFCLFHSLWYLLCLPSGYLYLIIYSICNLNDRSWGTRELSKQNTESLEMRQILKSLFDKIGEVCSCCGCCRRSEPIFEPKMQTSTDLRTTETQTDSERPPPPPQARDLVTDLKQSSDSSQPQLDRRHSPVADVENPIAYRSAAVTNSLPIEDFLERVGLTNVSYVQSFKEAGYDDTSFFIKMKPKDIEGLGVKSTGFINRIMKAIADLPDTTVPRAVPVFFFVYLKAANY